jgi:hypothetical protein
VRFQAVIGVAIAGSLLAGCGDTVASPPARSAKAAGRALTEAQARAILDRYLMVNNQANAKVSDVLLRSIETGPFLEADLATNKRIRAKREKKISAFTYRNPQFFIPHGVSPAWFGVLAQSSDSDDGSEFLVFADVGGGTYKATAGNWIAKGQKLPAIARGADGSATAVTTGPALSVGTKIASYLTAVANGGRVPGGLNPEPLIGHDGRYWAKAMKRNNRPGGQDRIRWQARAKPVYALKTADGGALVLNAGTAIEDYKLTRPDIELDPDPHYLGLGPKHYRHEFTGTMLWQFLTSVPPRGNAFVLAEGADTIAATGS